MATFSWGFTAATMKPPAVFLKKSHLFANASRRSDSSQYAIIIFQSLIRIFFSSGTGPD